MRTKYFTKRNNTEGNRVWRFKTGKFEYWPRNFGVWVKSAFVTPTEANTSGMLFKQITRDEARKLEPKPFRA